ncbi:MAG: type II toxin-antitoxin system PemK/MazF family toxin [Gaiellaceae bacterium]
MSRGEVYDVEWPGLGRRPAVIVTRNVAIPFLRNVVVALVTRTIRGLSTEVPLDEAQGLREESVINCDNLLTVPKEALVGHRRSLGPVETARLNDAVRFALDLD